MKLSRWLVACNTDIVHLPDKTGVVAAPPAEDGVEAVRVLTVPGAAGPGELAGERLQDVDQLAGGTLVEHLALLHLEIQRLRLTDHRPTSLPPD